MIVLDDQYYFMYPGDVPSLLMSVVVVRTRMLTKRNVVPIASYGLES